jgi:hypothetical protein
MADTLDSSADEPDELPLLLPELSTDFKTSHKTARNMTTINNMPRKITNVITVPIVPSRYTKTAQKALLIFLP